MIIDVHGHATVPRELEDWCRRLLDGDGRELVLSDEQIEAALHRPRAYGRSHLQILRDFGTDLQLISPRPGMLPHFSSSDRLIRRFVAAANDVVARQCRLHPEQFRGIAGLPQQAGASPQGCTEELERCIKELGFVGCSITPDPEGGVGARTPGMSNEYWYPLYEKLVALDVPGIIHSSGSCSPRASNSVHHIVEETVAAASLLEGRADYNGLSSTVASNRVFEDFPTLKLVISHGGGAIPYQVGRFKAVPYRSGGERFEDAMRRLYYDTCVYSRNGLDLLFKEIGPDRCVFGAEAPGQGSSLDPHTGQPMDDLKPVVESIEWLNAIDRSMVFEGNARALFKI